MMFTVQCHFLIASFSTLLLNKYCNLKYLHSNSPVFDSAVLFPLLNPLIVLGRFAVMVSQFVLLDLFKRLNLNHLIMKLAQKDKCLWTLSESKVRTIVFVFSQVWNTATHRDSVCPCSICQILRAVLR